MKNWAPFAYPDPNGKHRNANPSQNIRGSWPDGLGYQQLLDELSNGVSAAALTLSEGDSTQLAQALSRGIWFGTFSGTATALTALVPGSVTMPALVAGMRFTGVAASDCTGPATLTITGFTTAPGAIAIKRPGGATLQAGDWTAGQVLDLRYDGTRFQFATALASAIPSTVLVFQTSGTFTWTCPVGITKVRIRAWAGGGGAGGAFNTGSIAAAPGGGAGEYREGVLTVVPGTTYTITIGAGGVAGNGTGPSSGGNGGSTSFDVLLTAIGGAGSTAVINQTNATGPAGGSGGSGGSLSIAGSGGGNAVQYGTSAVGGGIGGSPGFGSGINGPNVNSGGAPGKFPGGGGTGGAAPNSSAGNAGGAGAGGLLILEC